MRTPKLDKQEISLATKSADKEMAKIQTLVLDAVAPLTALLETEASEEDPSQEEVLAATSTALELLGNANARISCPRREKVTQELNKALSTTGQER